VVPASPRYESIGLWQAIAAEGRDVSDEPTACFFVFQRAIRWVRRCGELVQEIERGCTLLACAEQHMPRVPIVTARHPVAFPAVHRVQEGGSF
jgi:hypothetical protein